jgi:ThiF family
MTMTRTSLERGEVEVTLIGAGRSGSQIALVATMLGFPLRVYDFDRLGPENEGHQLYQAPEIRARREKVLALRVLLRSLVPGARVTTHAERFEGRPDQPRSPVVVLAVDRMQERQRLWRALENARDLLLLVDVRIGPAQVRLHEMVRGREGDAAEYTASLHDDPGDEAGPACEQNSTAHASAAAAALVGGALCAFVDGMPRPRWVAIDLDRAQWCAGWPRELQPQLADVSSEGKV